ncbi:MAG: sugar ABC transporter ATP-binding protein [Aristaeellaceae bacterium]
MKQQSAFQLEDLSYTIDSREILRRVNLEFRPGAIHGILGQNGAGKTTLLNLLGGILQPTGGRILLDGAPVRFRSPHDAIRSGVRISVQEDSVLPDLTVAENMLLSHYGCGGIRTVHHRRLEREMQCILDELEIPLRAGKSAATLNYGNMQMLKIACLFAGKPDVRILLMDEPYRACPRQDVERFYATMRRLRDRGLTIIFSTHRVEDALHICDTLTLMQSSGACEQLPAGQLSFGDIVARISDRPFGGIHYPRLNVRPGANLLALSHVTTRRIEDVSFTLRKGEILGIAGLLGSGRTGIARALAGLDPLRSGSITMGGADFSEARQSAAPSDRIGVLLCNRKDSLLLNMNLPGNITVAGLDMVSNSLKLDTAAERKIGYDYCRQFNIDVRHLDDPVRVLSAGNQQKLLLARLFFSNCRLLVLDEPTMNIDIISKNDLYNLMNSYICRGNSIILISSDLKELKGMSHRVLVMRERRVLQEIAPADLTYQSLLAAKGEPSEGAL